MIDNILVTNDRPSIKKYIYKVQQLKTNNNIKKQAY